MVDLTRYLGKDGTLVVRARVLDLVPLAGAVVHAVLPG